MAEISRLPGPVADVWEWQYQGLCRDDGDELFFHPEGERGPRRRKRDAAAQAVCAHLPGDPAVPGARPGRPRALRRLGRPHRGRPRGDPRRSRAAGAARSDRTAAPPSTARAARQHDPIHRHDGAAAVQPSPSTIRPGPAPRRVPALRRRRRTGRSDCGRSVPGRSVAVPVAVAGPADSGSSCFFSTTRVSVVSTIEAIDAALRSAERVTLTGSMTPAAIRSPYSPVAAFEAADRRSSARTFSTTT